MASPMPGQILKVNFQKGDIIKKGDVILILTAMKMEHAIKANCDGIIKEIFFKEGEQVKDNTILLEIDPTK